MKIENMNQRELQDVLEDVFNGDPRLRWNPKLHDYQLTYPPAIQVEQPAFEKTPDHEEFIRLARGDFRNSAYYFHFGFCQYKCRYCFHYEIKIGRKEDLMTRYVEALIQEMRHMQPIFADLRCLLYFLGGGTPTMLSPRLLERFLDQLIDIYGQPPSDLSTVEAKPVTATNEKLDLLIQAGFRRINLGVQTLDPALYAKHHHGEDLEIALDAIRRARQRGFRYINIDLMTGLETQTPESFERTMKSVEKLMDEGAIDSLFIYPYHDDPRSKTFETNDGIPSIFETYHSDANSRGRFNKRRWTEMGARFYRSPRHRRREYLDFLKVRANPAYGEVLYHGFGNSSFSIGDKATYVNRRDANDYIEQIGKGALGISHWTPITDDQRATRDLIFDILYAPIVRVRSISKKYGVGTMESHIAQLNRWTDMGLGKWNRLLGIWRLTPLGKLVHQRMLPALYLSHDREAFDAVMDARVDRGRAYRGY